MRTPGKNDRVTANPHTAAPNADLLGCGDRYAVVDEGMIAYRNMRSFMGDDFDRHNGADQTDATSEFHISTSPNAPVKSHGQW
jgi:hypothetical protein